MAPGTRLEPACRRQSQIHVLCCSQKPKIPNFKINLHFLLKINVQESLTQNQIGQNYICTTERQIAKLATNNKSWIIFWAEVPTYLVK